MAKQKDSVQTITLTRAQFKALLKAVYLGNWMANAYSTDKFKKDYERAEDLIFSHCPKFGFRKYMDHEQSDGNRYYPTSYFEEETDVHKVHEEYDENTFWDELAERLGERDFFEQYSKEEIKKMSREEYFKRMTECVDYYHEEFEKLGLDRLRLENYN
ncbi:hypothetical protein M1615_00335 [Patescibacteria group bacterium]|nr:hypothetical protein [Patescibacteria group bacterium]